MTVRDSSDDGAPSTTTSLAEAINENKKRNREMHHHFHDRIPERDLCMATYTCSLKSPSGLSVPGKLYLTARHLLFHSYLGDTKQ
ncbi:hypothetical protein HDU91_000956, partial [Kappamyces sp. JEL0680]